VLPGNGRARYLYFIDLPNYSLEREDLQSGYGGGNLQDGLESLLSFLSAFAEAQSYPNSENQDLFPAELAEWATQNADEISMIQCELEESEEPIIEE
jgi:hypothetical protein